MKVFISHQKQDSLLAHSIKKYLTERHEINCYLDLFDKNVPRRKGPELGEYLRRKLGKCTHLLAVISQRTRMSWWVPWEIGIATEKNLPIATFAADNTDIPSYLKKWPYLIDREDLAGFADAAKEASKPRFYYLTEATAGYSGTQEFYRILRESLGQ